MAYPKRLRIDTVRTAAFGAIGAAYSAVGTAITDPCRIFCLTNITDQDVFFSIDGVNNHFIVPSNSFKLIDITANKVRDDGFFLPEGTVFYVVRAGAAPTVGAVYIEVLHG
jgi:hypothetical protein